MASCGRPAPSYTPYHKFKKVSWTQQEIERKEAINAEFAETDHAKLRHAITRWVRETGRKVLVGPEMTYQTEIIGPLVIDPLPADVKPSVVARDTYWITDEAASIYRRAAAVLSLECHSPILACAQGTPGLYVRQPTDTIKGQMWYDIHLDPWVFEIGQTQGDDLAEALLAIHREPASARQRLDAAMSRVNALQGEAMGSVRRSLRLSV